MKLIDADVVEKELHKWRDDSTETAEIKCTLSHVITFINNIPEIDAVKVIRCKNCKYYSHGYCITWDDDDGNKIPVTEDGFCAWARKVR